MSLISFDAPGKHQKTRGFLLIFSGASKEISGMKWAKSVLPLLISLVRSTHLVVDLVQVYSDLSKTQTELHVLEEIFLKNDYS